MIFTAICAFDYVIHAVHSAMILSACLTYGVVFAEFCHMPEFLAIRALIRCFGLIVFCSANLLICEKYFARHCQSCHLFVVEGDDSRCMYFARISSSFGGDPSRPYC
jgi:hypothetical protein